jgi:DNA-binding NtrC family response regulator
MPKILIVDDDRDLRQFLAEVLESDGFEVREAEDGPAALARVNEEPPALVILDISMPGLDGLTVLSRMRTVVPRLPIVMVTSSVAVRTAVHAMHLGADDYLTKPFDSAELVLRVRRVLDRQELFEEVETLRGRLAHAESFAVLAAASPAMQAVTRQLAQVADSPLTVLVEGETGTGKELVARAIHRESRRRNGPFSAVDCGAMSDTLVESELFGYERGAFTGADRRKEGRFQLAAGGTVFLDEIANLPAVLQPKLLRALQERQVWPLGARAPVALDVRVVAASNVPLSGEVSAGRFRQDLYYRLSEFVITLPPLRSRPEDVLPLATRFLDEATVELKRPARVFDDGAKAMLLEHSWPGNVRELRNVVRRAVLLGPDVIAPEHLDPGASPGDGSSRNSEACALSRIRQSRCIRPPPCGSSAASPASARR